MENTQEQLDPSIIALTKAIGHQESGGDYNKVGDNGHSMGAYQWNNKTPLAKGQIPANFKSYATEIGADPNDFSPANQDRVAYKTVEKWGKEGLKPAQIASRWNSGSPDTYLKATASGYNEEQGVHYDVKKYVDNVAKYYDEYKGKNAGVSDGDVTHETDLTKDQIISSPQDSSQDLKADTGKSVAGKALGAVADVIPGGKLAEAGGYALSNAAGTQKGMIEELNQGNDIQTKLLKQIKDNKAKGKDTARLEKALKDLGSDLENESGQVSDVGTGGITSKEIKTSAANLATLPVAAYVGTALGGGGLSGTARGLESGILGKSAPKILSNPTIQQILEGALGKGETLKNLSRSEALMTLSSALKDMSVTEAGSATEKTILEAIKALNPTLSEKRNLLSKLLKTGFDTAKGYALYKLLGDKVGGLVHKITP